MTYSDYPPAEVWRLMREVRDQLRAGSYTFGPTRHVDILKGSGGTRRLRLPSILDRVVQRSFVEVVQPALDPLFVPTSFGYRPTPHGGYHRAVAMADRLYTDRGLRSWVVVDVRDAFGSVPVSRLLDVVTAYFRCPGVRRLVRDMVSGERVPILGQGSPASPILLNLYLHHHLDRHWASRHPDWPLLRFADDLLVMCPDPAAAGEAYHALCSRLTDIGLAAKETVSEAVRVFGSGETAAWMGYEFRAVRGALRITPGPAAWSQLEAAFAECHSQPLSPIRAREAIVGWIADKAPCWPHIDPDRAYLRIRRIARSHAFDEIPGCAEVAERWHQVHCSWLRCREALTLPPSRSPMY